MERAQRSHNESADIPQAPEIQQVLNGHELKKNTAALLAPSELEKHAHRWRIDEPNGPVSAGRCLCGGTKDFNNSTPDPSPISKGRVRRIREIDY